MYRIWLGRWHLHAGHFQSTAVQPMHFRWAGLHQPVLRRGGGNAFRGDEEQWFWARERPGRPEGVLSGQNRDRPDLSEPNGARVIVPSCTAPRSARNGATHGRSWLLGAFELCNPCLDRHRPCLQIALDCTTAVLEQIVPLRRLWRPRAD